MDPLQELLGVDHRRVFDFFVLGLRDVSEPTVDHHELLYNASVLAHYAQTSTQAITEWPSPRNLSETFDLFVANTDLQHDSEMMEIAGTHCLFLAGFFEDQMRRRHSIRWYSTLGSGFFVNAAKLEHSSQKKAQLLRAIGRNFELWRQRQARLSRSLREAQYLLRSS